MSDEPIHVVVATADERTRQRIGRLIGAHQSFRVREARTPQELIAHLSTDPVDLVITDLTLPRTETIVPVGSRRSLDREVRLLEIRDPQVPARSRMAVSLAMVDFHERPFSRDELTRLARSRGEE